MDIGFQLLLFTVALVANMLSALAGGGAGLLQLPAILFLGLPFAEALATHKVASVALGVGAGARHWREKLLEGRFIAVMLLFGLPGVVAGAAVILAIPGDIARIALGLLTVGLGLYSLLSPQLGQHHRPVHRDAAGMLIGGAVLFVLGFINGSLTSGSGLFVTLWLVRWFGLDYTRAVAHTLILVGLFWNATGAATLGLAGGIRWDWVPALVLGSLVGGYAGANLGIARGNRFIKRVFEIVTIAVGVKLLVG